MTKLLTTLSMAHMLATQHEETEPVAVAAMDDVATRTKASIEQLWAIQRRRELFDACRGLNRSQFIKMTDEAFSDLPGAIQAIGERLADYHQSVIDRTTAAMPPLGHVITHSTSPHPEQ